MKKLSLTLFVLLPVMIQCAASSDEAAKPEQQKIALLRVVDLACPDFSSMPEPRELILESAQLSGGILSIKSSNIAISTSLICPGENGYALSQWKTATGKLAALALCAQSGRNTAMPMPILNHACGAFVKLCTTKITTASDIEGIEGLQKKIHETADEVKEVPLGSALFVSGILVQNGMIYTLMGNDTFSAIKVSGGRKVSEQKSNYSIGCGAFTPSWDPC